MTRSPEKGISEMTTGCHAMPLWEIDRAARLDELIAESNEIIDRALASSGGCRDLCPSL